jgi:hypothetical protein
VANVVFGAPVGEQIWRKANREVLGHLTSGAESLSWAFEESRTGLGHCNRSIWLKAWLKDDERKCFCHRRSPHKGCQ